jgi:hypothetical protein
MKTSLNILLSALLIISSMTAIAQGGRIVKDNVNCSYGIKNADGSWLVESHYTLIQQYNSGYFAITNSDGTGLMNPKGEWVLPCEYSSFSTVAHDWHLSEYITPAPVRSHYPTLIIAAKSNVQQVFNLRGDTITAPVKMESIQFDGPSRLMIYEKNGEIVHTTYLDTAGAILIPRIEGMIFLFGSNKTSLIAEFIQETGVAWRNVGLISNTGEIIIKRQFAKAKQNRSNRIWFVTMDNKFGRMNTQGDTLVAPIYSVDKHSDFGAENNEVWIISDEENQYGLMKANGEVLVVPAYDTIHTRSNSSRTPPWHIQKHGRSGLLSYFGEVLIPPIYTKLIETGRSYHVAVESKIYHAQYGEKHGAFRASGAEILPIIYDSIIAIVTTKNSKYHTRGFVVQKDGKFGVCNLDGEFIIPCTMDHHFSANAGESSHYLTKGRSITRINHWSGLNIDTLVPFVHSGEVNLYRSQGSVYGFIASENGAEIIGRDVLNSFNGKSHLYMARQTLPKSMLIFKSNGELLDAGRILKVEWCGSFTSLVGDSTSKLMHSRTGRIFAEGLYTKFQHNTSRLDRIWASKKNAGFNPSWVLLDSLGVQVIETAFDTPFQLDQGDIEVFVGGIKGIINSADLTWVIQPQNGCFFKIIGDLYYVGNKDGKRGVLRRDGTYLIPPIYDSISLEYSSSSVHAQLHGKDQTLWFRVRDGLSSKFIDNNGVEIKSAAQMEEIEMDFAYGDSMKIKFLNQAPSSFTLQVPMNSYQSDLGSIPTEDQKKPIPLFENRRFRRPIYDTLKSITANSLKLRQSSQYNSEYTLSTLFDPNSKDYPTTMDTTLDRSCFCNKDLMTRRGSPRSFGVQFSDSMAMTIGYNYTGSPHTMSSMPSVFSQFSNPTSFINAVFINNEIEFINLENIFGTDSLLRDEFIFALQKREDLNLDCSAPDKLTQLIEGRFSLANDGIHLYLSNTTGRFGTDWSYNFTRQLMTDILIPVERLRANSTTKWLGDLLYKEEITP